MYIAIANSDNSVSVQARGDFTNDSFQEYMNSIGDIREFVFSDEITPDNSSNYEFVNGELSLKTESLTSLKSRKINEIRNACGAEIDGGFEIDALNLGYNVHYRTNRDDQERIRNAKDDVAGGKIWHGEVLQLHTQEQAQAVWDQWLIHNDTCTVKYAGLFTQIKDATEDDREWLQSLTW